MKARAGLPKQVEGPTSRGNESEHSREHSRKKKHWLRRSQWHTSMRLSGALQGARRFRFVAHDSPVERAQNAVEDPLAVRWAHGARGVEHVAQDDAAQLSGLGAAHWLRHKGFQRY